MSAGPFFMVRHAGEGAEIWTQDPDVLVATVHAGRNELAISCLFTAAPMLLEGAQDAVKAFKLLRIGMAHEPKAIEVIDAHISELEHAIAKASSITIEGEGL